MPCRAGAPLECTLFACALLLYHLPYLHNVCSRTSTPLDLVGIPLDCEAPIMRIQLRYSAVNWKHSPAADDFDNAGSHTSLVESSDHSGDSTTSSSQHRCHGFDLVPVSLISIGGDSSRGSCLHHVKGWVYIDGPRGDTKICILGPFRDVRSTISVLSWSLSIMARQFLSNTSKYI